ncbi:non-ribosomal peptide synthetase, partial [Chitinophaga sp. Cy-1792]|uniref:non-ribosomal peptide synthetase n=1 Tax=Chitinophaga sp. Cy-1792 TaxID=2608339 RepID=UPI00141E75B4
FSGSNSYLQLLEQVRQVTMSAYEHQSYPFDELVDALPLKRDMSRSPLFDVMVVLQETDINALIAQSSGALQIKPYEEAINPVSKFDLNFIFEPQQDGLQLSIEYNSDLFHADTIARIATHLDQLLAAIVAHPAIAIQQLDYLGNEERTAILYDFNNTTIAYPSDKTITALFAAQAAKTPEKTALVFESLSLTYHELDVLSNQLAHYLQEQYHLGPDDLVGVMLERSEWLMVAVLGVLKSGGAYVPIDPDYPQERIDYVLEDTSCKVLIDVAVLSRFKSVQPAYDTTPVSTVNQPQDLAYVMYTSGSTGKPKGVMVTHQNVVRLVTEQNYISLTGDEILLSTGALSFDATTFEYWSMLLHGGKLVLCSQDALLDEQQLAGLITEHGVDVMWFTSGWLNQLVDKDIKVFEGLGTVITGGDKLSPLHIHTLQQYYPSLRIINGYGPTENTTFSLTYHIGNAGQTLSDIPVGRPIHHSTAYILDAAGQLCPIGVPGEIVVGGDGIARGYLNNAELTAARFISDPFQPGRRLYRTGDIGRWLPDGNIAFLGRKDDQVKIRGYRIEPGEITHALQSHPDVDAAIVVVRTTSQGEKELVAYLTSAQSLHSTVLRSWLDQLLPAHMIPAYFVQLDSFPLNANGKVDRRQLPAPEDFGLSSGTTYIPARNNIEAQLIAIWEQVLGRTPVGVKDNFFDLGGHSLKATRLGSLIHKAFDVKLPLKELFSNSILEQQGGLIAASRKTIFSQIAAAPEQASYPLSSSQRRLWVLSQFEEGSVAYNMPGVYTLTGALDIARLEAAFKTLIARHEILRTVFKEEESGVQQYILAAIDFKIAALTDISTFCYIPFDLSAGPLLRAAVGEVSAGEWVFVYVMHHIISDGWSMGVLIKELLHIYHDNSPLPVLPLQYKDYAVWQQSGSDTMSQAYWLEQFSGELPVLELPADKPRPAVKTYHGGLVQKQLALTGLQALLQSTGSTLFMGLVAAVNALLYRYSGQEDIILGSPVAGREHADLEGQIGFYVNTLALRTRFSGSNNYLQLLEQVRQVTMSAYEHQSYPFDELVDALPLKR